MRIKNVIPNIDPSSVYNKIEVKCGKYSVLGVLIFSVGCLLDHITTAYGLTIPGVVETNPFVLRMINYGVWHFFEFLILVSGIFFGFNLGSLKSGASKFLFIVALNAVGLCRFLAGLYNLEIIFRILM